MEEASDVLIHSGWWKMERKLAQNVSKTFTGFKVVSNLDTTAGSILSLDAVKSLQADLWHLEIWLTADASEYWCQNLNAFLKEKSIEIRVPTTLRSNLTTSNPLEMLLGLKDPFPGHTQVLRSSQLCPRMQQCRMEPLWIPGSNSTSKNKLMHVF